MTNTPHQVHCMTQAQPVESNIDRDSTTSRSIYFEGASYCWENARKGASPDFGEGVICLPTNRQSPLGICISAPCEYIRSFSEGPFSSRHLIDGILRELNNRTQSMDPRQAPWLSWQIPHSLVESSDITEIMYFIGRRFQLGNKPSCHYQVRFRQGELDNERAALFKGLGFNSLELFVPGPSELTAENLRATLRLSQEFHYDQFQLTIDTATPSLPMLLSQQIAQSSQKPDIVCYKGATNTQKSDGGCIDRPANIHAENYAENHTENYADFFRAMRDMGYRVLGNDCFVSADTDLARGQNSKHLRLNLHGYNVQNVTDILGLGPGANTSIQQNCHQNPVEFTEYLSQTFPKGDSTPSPVCLKKLIIDQLLCYHQLDINYFRTRYKTDLAECVPGLWNHLNSPEKPLYAIHNDQLSLTPEGILALASLCQAIIYKPHLDG